MKHAGFTLIELLIVVAIIAILAAIAVPNFLEAQTRSKVSRVESDMRSLAVGLQSYYVDNNRYPRQGPSGTCVISQSGLWEVTSPIAYITSYPIDVFHQEAGTPQPIYYGVCNSGSIYFYTWSFGPDREDQFAVLLYDPTNGTISAGDVKRTTAADKLTVDPQ